MEREEQIRGESRFAWPKMNREEAPWDLLSQVVARPHTPPELVELINRARKAEGHSEPRKHHLVPASYLRRWRDVNNQVRVTQVDERRSWVTAPEKAARETDYYRVEHEQIDRRELPPLLMETLLSTLEESAKQAIDVLMTEQPVALDAPLFGEFAWHIAFQATRGKVFRDDNIYVVNEMNRLRFRDMDDEAIERNLSRAGQEPTAELVAKHRAFLQDIRSGKITLQGPPAQQVGFAARAAADVFPHLLAREWHVFETPPALVTCDEPVLLVGGPGLPRHERAGAMTASVVLFPLAPTRLLAMFRHDVEVFEPLTLDAIDTAEVNRELAAVATRWIFELPSRHVGESIALPARGEVYKLEQELVNVEPGRARYRYYKPNRWRQEPRTPWPVARWWA